MRRIFFFAVTIVLMAAFMGRAEAAPKKNPITDNWYDVVASDPGAQNFWLDAEMRARSLGGHLASILSAEEGDWVYLNFIDGTNRNYWIGLNDMDLEGLLNWADGEGLAYTNWQPAWHNTDGRDYAFIRQSDAKWDLGYRNDYRLGIAEWPAATPEPLLAGFVVFGGALFLAARHKK